MGTVLPNAVTALLGVLFAAAGGVFVFESWLMWREYGEWAPTLASYASHQFVFFPTLGLAILACFFPLTRRMVLRTIEGGLVSILRMVMFTAIVVGLAFAVANVLGGSASTRSIWEIAPQRSAVAGQPSDCAWGNIISAYTNLHAYARIQPDAYLSQAAPSCDVALPQVGKAQLGYCVAAGAVTDDAGCCAAQAALSRCVAAYAPSHPSQLAQFHQVFLTVATQLLIGVFALGLSLVWTRMPPTRTAPGMTEQLALTGALLLALWSVLNLVYVESSANLIGATVNSAYRSFAPLFIAAYVCWLISILMYLQSQFNSSSEWMWRIITVAIAALGALNFDAIIAVLTRYMGPGATVPEMVVFILLYGVVSYQIAALILGGTKPKPAPAQQSAAGAG